MGMDPATTIIDGMMAGDVIEVTVPWVNINNITVMNSGSGTEDAGIQITDTHNVSIADVDCTNCEIGIYVDPSENVTIKSSEGDGCQWFLAYDRATNCEAVDINVVNVQDSNAEGGAVKATDSNGLDINNPNWNFGGSHTITGVFLKNSNNVLVRNATGKNTNNGSAIKSDNGTGNFFVDSFFDVTYDVDFPNGTAVTFTNSTGGGLNNVSANVTNGTAIKLNNTQNVNVNNTNITGLNCTGLSIGTVSYTHLRAHET